MRNMLNLINDDCMNHMPNFPDKYFDLAIVDVPYNIKRDGQRQTICKNPKHNRKLHKQKDWDKATPTQKYFDELFRISKNQIIWGANYLVKYLTEPTMGWIFWFKGQNGLTMSDGEIAFSSFNKATRQIEINRVELSKENTFHPTQKPVKLYEWLLSNYAKKGDKILDTHLGSGSIVIACLLLGFDITGFEIDSDYYNDMMKRINTFQNQISII